MNSESSFHPKIQQDEQDDPQLNVGYYGQRVAVACFTNDGSRVLTVRNVGIAQIWDTATGALVGELHPDSPFVSPGNDPNGFKVFIESASLSLDGLYALLGLNDNTAGIYEISSARRLATLHLPEQKPATSWGRVRAVAYSPDGSKVAIGFDNRNVGIWDSTGSTCLAILRDPFPSKEYLRAEGRYPLLVSSVSFGTDSRYLFVRYADGSVSLWDFLTYELVFSAIEHTERIIAVQIYGSSVRWATDSGCVWEVDAMSVSRRVISVQERWVEATFSPDATLLLTRSLHHVRRWNLETGDSESYDFDGSFFQSARACMLTYSADGQKYLFPVSRNRLRLVGSQEMSELQRADRIEHIRISSSGALFFTMGDEIVPKSQYSQVELWSMENGNALGCFAVTDRVCAAAVSPDDTRLAIGVEGIGGDGPVRPITIWNIADGQICYTLRGHTHQVHNLAFSPDGRSLISTSLDRTVCYWMLGEDREPQPTAQLTGLDLDFAHASLYIFSDGRILVFRQSCIEIWHELRDLRLRIWARIFSSSCWCISSDEQQIAITYEAQRVGIWSLEDGAFLGWKEAAIARSEPFLTEELRNQIFPMVSTSLWHLSGGPYVYIGEGPLCRATNLQFSRDRKQAVIPCLEGAALFSLEPEPWLVQSLSCPGLVREICITDTKIVLLDSKGALYQIPRGKTLENPATP